MAIRIVRLGSDRATDEGLRIGTVRRPPRGVPKAKYASQNWYDVWLPNLAPSVETMKMALRATTPAEWAVFVRLYRREMAAPENIHLIALLAALSHQTDFSVGCYCEIEAHCHRSILRELLRNSGAAIEAVPEAETSSTRTRDYGAGDLTTRHTPAAGRRIPAASR